MKTFSLLAAGLLLSEAGAFAEPVTVHPIISEDFESTPVGSIPQGFTKTGAIMVVDDVAHSGKHSLRMDPAVKGPRRITKTGPEIAALGGEHWGRLYYKVKLPVPAPAPVEGKTNPSIHATFVSGNATSPLAQDPIEVRLMGMGIRSDTSFRYLYNVQTRKGRGEFGVSAKSPSNFTDKWVLAEWHVDYATQTYQFFVDGQEITDIAVKNGAGKFEKSEIPAAFDDLSFGFINYQPATGEGFTVWIDDLALGKQRLGPVAAK